MTTLARLLVVALALSSVSAGSASKATTPGEYFVYVGSSDSGRATSKGISIYRFTPSTGQIATVGVFPIRNPFFLAVSPDHRFLYTVDKSENEAGSKVSALALDPANGALTLIDQVSSRGANPVYTELDKSDKYVLVANYLGGTVAAFRLRADGGIGESTALVSCAGEHSPQHPERPPGPYPHAIDMSPDNRFALVTALGLDRLYVYRFDPEHGALSPHDPPFVSLPPGAGPRHIAFDPSGTHVYVMDETAGAVTVFSYAAATGTLRPLQTISTLPSDFKGNNQSGDIEVHPTGRFLFASNRGHDSIAVFGIDPSKGTLVLTEIVPSHGSRPGNFRIDPTGSYLFVANEQSNNVVVFKIDGKTGRLTATGQALDVAGPQNIVFVAVQ